MCFETTARPPLPPIAGAAGIAGTERTILDAGDGNRFNAFVARALTRESPGVMILPDIRGLHPYYEDLAVRFAKAGAHAVAMDYFGRTAGLGARGDGFDTMAHVAQLTTDGIGEDTAATLAYLRTLGAGPLYTVGFCLGGRISFNQAWRDHGLSGVIGFYGGPQGRGPDDDTAPMRLAPMYRCKVLGLFGGADEGIPEETVDAFGHVLDEAGVENEMVIYDGAPHSFFDRSFDQHRDACDDAWRRMLASMGLGSD